MKQSSQLGDFKSTKKQAYDSTPSIPATPDLFIHKQGFPNIRVRAPHAHHHTAHCWRLKVLEVTQYGSECGASQIATAQVEFDGELIFSLLDMFNQMMANQILEYVENITNQLRAWCEAPINNIFLVQQRTMQSFGYKHGFLKITPVLFYTNHSHYFEYRRWSAEIDSQMPEIENAENVTGSSNYYAMFDHICRKIERYKAMKRKQKQDKLEQQARKLQEEARRKLEMEMEDRGKYSESWYKDSRDSYYEDSINQVKYQELEDRSD